MSFNGSGLFEPADAAASMLPPPPFVAASGPRVFSSPALSLGLLHTHQLDDARSRGLDAAEIVRPPDENESARSGSDHIDAFSADGQDLEPDVVGRKRKAKRYHRHTAQQIQELEALFKECPHPDEKQRQELSKRLCLESRQVKFWFQNRRTQMKMQMERHENAILKQENDRLRAENLSMREAMRSPVCGGCGGPAMLGEVSLEEQHLRIENSRLRDELARVCALASKFFGKPIPMPPATSSNSSLELAVGTNAMYGAGLVVPMQPPTVPGMRDFHNAVSSPMGSVITPARVAAGGPLQGEMGSDDKSLEKTMLLELALSAMDELLKMAQMEQPLWVPCVDSLVGGGATAGKVLALNYQEYIRMSPLSLGARPTGFVSEATCETGMVIISSAALVETLMDTAKWADMFSCMVARAATTEVIATGIGGTWNGALQLMHAEFQVLSPLVPIREATFLRFCKQLVEGTWAVVDVSVDGIGGGAADVLPGNVKCRRLPSGCLLQDSPNGYCKVTWVEHAEYDEAAVHRLYQPLIRSGLALGARRWLSTLQRQCDCLAILMSPPAPTGTSPPHQASITTAGRRSMLKLARRMTDNFCAGVNASSTRKWSKLVGTNGVGEDVRVMTRQSVDEPGEPPGVVLSAATSVSLPVAPQRLFDFLRDERLRSEWDILSNGGPMEEMQHIAKGQHRGNSVSLLRASAVGANQSSMLILQETFTDPSGSMVVYAPVDMPAMHMVMSGRDSTYVALLPSGFAILPDCPYMAVNNSPGGSISQKSDKAGSLLTVAFQILVNSQPTAKLTLESVETVNSLISCTIKKIRTALHCADA